MKQDQINDFFTLGGAVVMALLAGMLATVAVTTRYRERYGREALLSAAGFIGMLFVTRVLVTTDVIRGMDGIALNSIAALVAAGHLGLVILVRRERDRMEAESERRRPNYHP